MHENQQAYLNYAWSINPPLDWLCITALTYIFATHPPKEQTPYSGKWRGLCWMENFQIRSCFHHQLIFQSVNYSLKTCGHNFLNMVLVFCFYLFPIFFLSFVHMALFAILPGLTDCHQFHLLFFPFGDNVEVWKIILRCVNNNRFALNIVIFFHFNEKSLILIIRGI